MLASFDNKKESNPGNQNVQDSLTNHSAGGSPSVHVPTCTPDVKYCSGGVSNCYVFKSRLQEYAQKVGLPTPIYETIKEGPSHEPSFRSTVIVNGVRYDSLPGFFNRKAAEQSAAEIALMELSKCGDVKASISVPVHETGLCKNLLQEYAQKMNYAIPTYVCQKEDTAGRSPNFWCTVEIGGIQYIGATATTKKEAEIKAARTALLAIRSNPTSVAGENFSNKSQYTVVPSKRKVPETALPLPPQPQPQPQSQSQLQPQPQSLSLSQPPPPPQPQPETLKPKKPKKPRFKKRRLGKTHPPDAVNQIEGGNMAEAEVAVKEFQQSFSDVQLPNDIQTPHSLASAPQENGSSNTNQTNGDGSIAKVSVDHDSNQLAVSSAQQPGVGNNMPVGSSGSLANENKDPVASNVQPVMNDPPASGLSDALV